MAHAAKAVARVVAKAVARVAVKAVARPAPMDVVKVAVKDVEKDAIAVADAAHVLANAAVSAAANASVLMPKENRQPLATTPRAWLWMPTAPRAHARHADAAGAVANVVSAASVPNALRAVNARRIAVAMRLRKPTPMAMTPDRVKHSKAVKADAAVVVVAVAMTEARVWTKPATRFLQPQAKTKPIDKHLQKAQTTRAAMAAAHATVMAASVARVAAAMPVWRTSKSKPPATSRCASPSARAKTAIRRCVRTSRKPRLHQRAHRQRHKTAMRRPPWRRKPTRFPIVWRKPTRLRTVRYIPTGQIKLRHML